MCRAAESPNAVARSLTPARARNLPDGGRSAALCEPQQPLTSDGPPLTATSQLASLQPRDQEQRGTEHAAVSQTSIPWSRAPLAGWVEQAYGEYARYSFHER